MYRLSTDVGGTFTDGLLLDESTGTIEVSKVSSTPKNPATGTIQSMEKFKIPFKKVSFLVHGTTVVINALIEGKGSRTALITTKGFRDVLEIGRSNRTEMYNALYKKPKPLIPRYLRLEVEERIGADRAVLVPLEIGELDQIIEHFRKENVESIAVCLINGYANSKHEQEIGRALKEKYPEVTVSLSHNITRRYYEYERVSTTAQNSYVMPVVQRYLMKLEEELEERDFQSELQIMQSNGGIMNSSIAREIPVAMVESGPVAGVIGAAMLAGIIGYNNVITYDMGGTTAKTSIVTGGLPETTDQYVVEGRPILLPVVDILEIGAGGGSIAWIDEAGALHVGPQSAGAEPGPACYKRGGAEPTVTDADLQLGILDPDYFLGGEMDISPKLSCKSIEKIAHYFDISINEAALGIIKIVNNNMSGLLQSMTVKRGYDPRDFAMVAFGGAGPAHAAAIAKELNIPKVIVPQFPGVFSAWGMLMADLKHNFSQTYIQLINDADIDVVNGIFKDLEGRIKKLFEHENISEKKITMIYEMNMRYYGQEHTLKVPASPKFTDTEKEVLSKRFDELHLRVHGHNAPEEPKEIASFNVLGIGSVRKPALQTISCGSETPVPESKRGHRKVYMGDGNYQEYSIYLRAKLQATNIIAGPAVIEEPTSTTVVESDQICSVDQYGNLIIKFNREEK